MVRRGSKLVTSNPCLIIGREVAGMSNPLIPNLKCGLDFFMFKPDIFTITRNTHKVALQNYATALPHQKGLKYRRSRPPITLTQLQARVFGHFSKSGLNLLLL